MKILVGNDGNDARTSLTQLLEAAGYETVATASGESALRLLDGPDAPPIALVDANLPGVGGLEVCRRTRSRGGGYRYLLLLTGRADALHTAEALEAGADDVIAKPWSPEELLARIRTGERIVGVARRPTAFQSALDEALSGIGGELVVRAGSVYGRIFTHAGRIVWIEQNPHEQSLFTLLRDATGLSADDWRGIVEECRTARIGILEGIARWGVADAETVAACTRRLVAARLERLAGLDGVSVFLPHPRDYAGRLSFGLGELGVPDAPSAPRMPSPQPRAVTTPTPLSIEARELVNALLAIPGARDAAVVDLDSSEIAGRGPDPAEVETSAHGHGRALRSLSVDDRTDEVISASESLWRVISRLKHGQERCLYVTVDQKVGTLGGTLARIRQIVAQWEEKRRARR